MQRCLDLAINGIGKVAPNPMVGSVIVYNNKIIGEGYHQQFGGAHAEVNAINSVADKSLLKKATLYINLEPCSHFGKTPPCVDFILKNNIKHVVISCIDTSDKVSGKGIEKLITNGVDVKVGVLEKESIALNKRFFTFHSKKRPFIILKWAQTLDGYISNKKNSSTEWISNQEAKLLSHKWRAEESAIFVGTNTAKWDNPKLDIRDWQGVNPTRICIDRNLEIPTTHFLFNGQAKTLVFNAIKTDSQLNLEYIKIDFTSEIEERILNHLYKKDIQSVIIEGGAKLLTSFINKGLWDEARVFVANKMFSEGIKAPTLPFEAALTETISNNKLLLYSNQLTKQI